MVKKLVILTGAGMSAESGINTFRDVNGLWEGHDILEVASPGGFNNNPELVFEFYNKRRAQLYTVKPNKGHLLLKDLEAYYQTTIITQNVDDLHERAGSKNIIHLHGELRKARSIIDNDLIYKWVSDLNLGDKNEEGHQLRPHIVWFGEEVPKIDTAITYVKEADILVIIGTSMQVYPAAGLVNYCKPNIPIYFIDPKPTIEVKKNLTVIATGAITGITELVKQLIHT